MKAHLEDDKLIETIVSVDRPRPREAFRTGLRSALLITAAEEWRAPARTAPRFTLAFAARYVVAAAVVLAVALGTTGFATAASLPGDATYGVKLAYEQVELALASDDTAKLDVLARQADRRLDELNKVSGQRPEMAPSASVAYQQTLAKFQAAVDALNAAEPAERSDAALDRAEAEAEKHIEVLEAIKERHDTPGIENALQGAHELQRHTKSKDGRRDGDQRDEPRKGDDQNVAPTPANNTRPVTPRPGATPRPSFRIESPRPSGDD